jgi:hypothetical protein
MGIVLSGMQLSTFFRYALFPSSINIVTNLPVGAVILSSRMPDWQCGRSDSRTSCQAGLALEHFRYGRWRH